MPKPYVTTAIMALETGSVGRGFESRANSMFDESGVKATPD